MSHTSPRLFSLLRVSTKVSFLALALFLLLSVSPSQAQSIRDKTIQGTVVDANGNPVQNVEITLFEYASSVDSWSMKSPIKTDANGFYKLENLSNAKYRIQFDGNVIAREYYRDRATFEEAEIIDLSSVDGVDLAVADAVVTRSGVIRGKVTDLNGAPLDRISVTAYEWEEGTGGSVGEWESADFTYTASDGTYLLYAFEEIGYRLEFDGGVAYVTEYYNDAPTLEAAQTLIVPNETILTDMNAQLQPHGLVTGTVTSTEGQPLKDVTVIGYKNAYHETAARAVTNASGHYAFPLPPDVTVFVGFYHDNHNIEYYDDQANETGAISISVPLGAVLPNINAQLTPGPLVQGTVKDNSGARLPGMLVQIERLVNYGGYYGWLIVKEIWSDDQGEFSIHLASDHYMLRILDPAQNHHGYTHPGDSPDTLEPQFFLSPGETLTVDATLQVVPTIRGTVTNQEGGHAPAQVRLYKRALVDGEMQWTCCARTTSMNMATEYRFADVEAGEYIVSFSGDDIVPGYYQEFFPNQPTLEQATIFTVTEFSIYTGVDAVMDTPGTVSADFRATPRKGAMPLRVEFEDASVGLPIARHWNFGDGATSEALHPHHTYQAVGHYTVTLTITDTEASSVVEKTNLITVTEIPDETPAEAPVEALTLHGMDSTGVGFSTLFSATIAAGDNVTFEWDFGDGQRATGAVVSYTYRRGGVYTVTLTARNSQGEQQITRQVAVQYVLLLPRLRR